MSSEREYKLHGEEKRELLTMLGENNDDNDDGFESFV